MRIKTYYAQTMHDALRDIKAELGPEALLLSTRETPSRSGMNHSRFEVVAAVDDNSNPEALPPFEETEPVPAVYSQASLVRESTLRSPAETPAAPFNGTASVLFRDLIANEVDESLARTLITQSVQGLNRRQRRNRAVLVNTMRSVARELMVDWNPAQDVPRKRVVAFLGPTGVGKTTTLAKIAARLTLQHRKKVVLMSLDGYRIGAIDQLKTYASLMGVPFRFIGDIADLPSALQEHAHRDYVLLDTTGRGPRDAAAIAVLSGIAESPIEMERHLVLSATTKASDLNEIIDSFEPCKPDHLVFTKLDETTTLGPIFNQLVRTRKPLSYCTDGQRVPEDLHVFPKERILDIVLKQS